jgi:hypothetical protein
VDPEQRPALDAPRRREARAAADRLHEPGALGGDLRLGPQNLEPDAGNDDRLRTELERRRAHEAAAAVTGVDDPAVLDLDLPGRQIRLAEAVGVPQPAQIAGAQAIGRRLVVVADAELERQLRHPWIASDGIHEIAVTDPSMRIGALPG